MTPPTPESRRAGILVPLFSIPSTRSWGIGEIGDIECMARWLARAGLRVLQLLPINEMPPGEGSPYSALSAMAIDPQFISLWSLEDVSAVGGEAALALHERAALERARAAPRIDYLTVRALKHSVLRRAYARFRDAERATGSPRASAFQGFCAAQSWWLDDYALFRALHARYDERSWMEWPDGLRDRHPAALERARVELDDEIMFRQYLQWIAGEQWHAARGRIGPVALYGDLPFMVSADSADVWARQEQFRLDVSVGAPPDAFSEFGQDWGLPAYRWDVLLDRNLDWLRDRARRYADLYDGYRIDHLVGFYRTYFRSRDGAAEFSPSDPPAQQALGERVLGVLREAGADLTAEDLGTVPAFVRESLVTLGVPGCKVFRWERQWDEPGQPYTDPVDYPEVAVAMTGTHDTEPMAVWWENATREDKEGILAIQSIAERLTAEDRARLAAQANLSTAVRDALLESLYQSAAYLLILPIQDVFGWRDRINQPATIGDHNWTWRLPWPCDRLESEPEATAVAQQLRAWASRYGRG